MSEPSRALRELLYQHAALRVMMDDCDRMPEPHEIAKLRDAFDAHNRFEEQLLKPILAELDSFGEVRSDRMLADHLAEHRALVRSLEGTPTQIRATLQRLRIHIDDEERYFLSSRVLRDDVISVEGAG